MKHRVPTYNADNEFERKINGHPFGCAVEKWSKDHSSASEEQRIENEKIVASEAQRLHPSGCSSASEEHHQRTAHLYAIAPEPQGIIPQHPVHISEVIPSIVAQLSTDSKPNVPPPPEAEFRLGPGPLTNENVVTPHPPLPVINDPSQPYRTNAQPGTAQAALEVASLQPVEGAKVTYPCPSCGKIVTTGDVHAC